MIIPASMTLILVSSLLPGQAFADVVNGCINKRTGNMRITGASKCKKTETLLSWNSTGEPGPQGPLGPQGPQGETGAQGPAGAVDSAVLTQINTDISSLKTTTGSLTTDVASLKTDLNALKTRTTALETGQASAKNRLDNLETRMTAVEDHLISVDTQINDIKSGAGLIKDRVGVYEDAYVRVRVTGESRLKDVKDNVTLTFGFEVENISGADLYLGRPGNTSNSGWSNTEFSVQEDGSGALCEGIDPVGLTAIYNTADAKSNYQKIPAGGSIFASWTNTDNDKCQNLFSGFTYNISFDLARYDTTAQGGVVIGTISFKHQLPTAQ